MRQNLNEFFVNKYQKHVAYGYKFSKPFKSHLGKDAVYNFICSMIEESKYCSDAMKKHFNKELVMMQEDTEHFENLTKCWICHNDYIDSDVRE